MLLQDDKKKKKKKKEDKKKKEEEKEYVRDRVIISEAGKLHSFSLSRCEAGLCFQMF